MDKEKMGLFIAELRKEKGLTQEDLARQFYVDRATISKWEKGYYIPTPEMLLELSNFFGVTVNEILLGEKKSENNEDKVNKVTVEILKNRDKKVKRIIRISMATVICCVVLAICFGALIKLNANRQVEKMEKQRSWPSTLKENQVPYYLGKKEFMNDFKQENFKVNEKVDIYIKGEHVPEDYQKEPFITNVVLKSFNNEDGELVTDTSDFLYVFFGVDNEAYESLKDFVSFKEKIFKDAKLYLVKTNSSETKNAVNDKIKKLIDEQVVEVPLD